MLRFLFVLTLAFPSCVYGDRMQGLMERYRNVKRPILLFGDAYDPRIAAQFHQFTLHPQAFATRDMIVIQATRPKVLPQLPPPGIYFASVEESAELLQTCHIAPHTFTVILVGKDGGEKFRSITPVSFTALATIIDGMPMRRQEMKSR